MEIQFSKFGKDVHCWTYLAFRHNRLFRLSTQCKILKLLYYVHDYFDRKVQLYSNLPDMYIAPNDMSV